MAGSSPAMTSAEGYTMPDAYIFDHVRTPRGKGKKDGSLHEVTPIRLATQMLEAIRDRNKGLDTREIEDVILGCVTPVGEQGTNIARTAVMQSARLMVCLYRR